MIVTYKHKEGACDFTLELDVEHHKSVYFICPKCNWTSEFIPTEDYDNSDAFELNPFKVIDESLFEVIKKPARKSKGTTKTTKTRTKVVKLKKGAMETCNRAYSFNYKASLKIKETLKNRKDGKS